MKTKELIKHLQDADPTGELDVTVGKNPIIYVDVEPYYYDGRYLRINGNYESLEYPVGGHHVMIVDICRDSIIFDYPDIPFVGDVPEWYLNKIIEERQYAKELYEKFDIEYNKKAPIKGPNSLQD